MYYLFEQEKNGKLSFLDFLDIDIKESWLHWLRGNLAFTSSCTHLYSLSPAVHRFGVICPDWTKLLE